ncbi:MAG TPA: CapA family protein [Acidimicrobiia bacterium]|nr:CapA family protein [Acidimicrobiia bacterium]
MNAGRLRLALAGDTMLGRGVGAVLAERPPASLISPELTEIVQAADRFVLNLECCISERGRRWPDPGKPFFFRAPPAAVDLLVHLGVDAVTLANNHALDYGWEALLDTLELLDGADIAHVGAGVDASSARQAVELGGPVPLRMIGLTDHPREYAAGEETPGVAWADLPLGVPAWVGDALRPGPDAITLATPHWGPNMTTVPLPYVQRAAAELVGAGVSLVAGHSAHVFHGIQGRVAFDLGDFIDDYAVDPRLRNDLGILLLVDLAPSGPSRFELIPLELDYAHTRVARGEQAAWVRRRLTSACAEMGTEVSLTGDRLVVEVPVPGGVERS